MYYCVKENENDTRQYPYENRRDCHTLQYLINNSTTVNICKANVTLYFMPGTHDVSFTERVNITAPAQLKMIGLDVNVTVRAHRSCLDSDVDCGLFFKSHSRDKHISVLIKNLIFHNVSIKLNSANVTLYNCQNWYQSRSS